MQKIEAIIQPSRLDAVKEALIEIGVDVVAAPGATLGLSYIGQYSDDFSDTGLRGRLSWTF